MWGSCAYAAHENLLDNEVKFVNVLRENFFTPTRSGTDKAMWVRYAAYLGMNTLYLLITLCQMLNS